MKESSVGKCKLYGHCSSYHFSPCTLDGAQSNEVQIWDTWLGGPQFGNCGFSLLLNDTGTSGGRIVGEESKGPLTSTVLCSS